MSTLKQEAVNIIENLQEDVMVQVVAYLQNIASAKNYPSKSLEGFHILQSFAGTLPENFNYEKELEDSRNEKYNRFN